RFAAAVVSRPQPPPVEHPARRQSRLAVRRLRIVCADLDGRSGHALLARAVAVSADSCLYRHGRRHHAAGLGDRRHRRWRARRLHRAQAHDDSGDISLLDHDRAHRDLVRLDIVRDSAVPCRHCDRLGMGDRFVDDGRAVARSRPRPRRRPHAMRHRHRQLPRGLCMALCRRVRPRVLAVLVSHRHPAGAADVVDSHGIPESGKWEQINERRKAARARQRSGTELVAEEHALTRFTAADLFVNAEIRRRTVIALLLSLTTTLAWRGISSWLPPYAASLATKANRPAQQWAAYAGMAYNFGGVLGYICLGFLADWIGRRPTAMLYFAMAFIMTPVLYLWTQDLNLLLLAAAINAFFTLG